jgi:UDP-GlcNAc3NAcA epimerase
MANKVLAIIGARPQFIKHFPFEKAAEGYFDLITVHTGQHYDQNMSQVFFDQLGMKTPHYQLQTGGGNHGVQTGKMMAEIEEIVLKESPQVVVVYGDTNSTLAGALVASKLHIPVVHIEAGLRSYNRSMPEEINRVLTDHMSTLLLVPSEEAVNNLEKEGIRAHVHIVGDIMKDMVQMTVSNGWATAPDTTEAYYYATIHRPYNTDERPRLKYVLDTFQSLNKRVVFSIHPRTRNAMKTYGMDEADYSNIQFIDPQGYFENLGWLQHADALITDSGGMQKEAYWLEKKCITIRKETEWVETLAQGANVLVFNDLSSVSTVLESSVKPIFDTELYGNGRAANAIIDCINQVIAK